MGRIIGLDLGSKTCGVAISDQTGFLARALTTIRFEQEDYDDCFDQILNLLEKEKVNEVVLGLPKHMNGDVGIRGQLSIDFGYELEQEGYQMGRIAVECNGEIVPKAVYGEKILKDGDVLEVVSFVGGG